MTVHLIWAEAADRVIGADGAIKGIEIMEGLRGHTSGYAVPQYIVDAPGGGGKIPVTPNYLLPIASEGRGGRGEGNAKTSRRRAAA